MTPDLIFWIKWSIALVGIALFALWFRTHARREHEREMEELARQEWEKSNAPVSLEQTADRYRENLGRSMSPMEVSLDANRRMNAARRELAEREESTLGRGSE